VAASLGTGAASRIGISRRDLGPLGTRMNQKYTMFNSQFQVSYYLKRLRLRLDGHLGGAAVRRVLAFVVVAFATLSAGCVQDGLMDIARFQLKPDDVIIERRPDTAYEKLVPYYVELCAASQFRSKLTGEGGGPAGHASRRPCDPVYQGRL
jgi:hypothetical protein